MSFDDVALSTTHWDDFDNGNSILFIGGRVSVALSGMHRSPSLHPFRHPVNWISIRGMPLWSVGNDIYLSVRSTCRSATITVRTWYIINCSSVPKLTYYVCVCVNKRLKNSIRHSSHSSVTTRRCCWCSLHGLVVVLATSGMPSSKLCFILLMSTSRARCSEVANVCCVCGACAFFILLLLRVSFVSFVSVRRSTHSSRIRTHARLGGSIRDTSRLMRIYNITHHTPHTYGYYACCLLTFTKLRVIRNDEYFALRDTSTSFRLEHLLLLYVSISADAYVALTI